MAMTSLRRLFASAWLRAVPFVIVSIAGCALFGGGSGAPPKVKGAHVTVPAGWKETDRGESDGAYRLPSGSIANMNSACNRESRASLELLTRQLLFGLKSVKMLERRPLSIPGGEALHTSLSATEKGTPFRLEIVVVKKDGCVIDFSLMNPKDIGRSDIDQFLTFAKSFRYGKD